MSNNKQTSVEQLFHKLWDTPKDKFTWYAILKEHMAMHKQEMIEFANDLLAQNDINYIAVPNLAEQYYNETYGGGEQ